MKTVVGFIVSCCLLISCSGTSDPGNSSKQPRVIYYSTDPATDSTTFIINADGTDNHPVLTNCAPMCAPAGNRLVLATPTLGIYRVITLEGVIIADSLALGSYSVGLSPDGSKMTYVRAAKNQMHIANSDGSGDVILASYAVDQFQPSFSPSGNYLLYITLDSSGTLLKLYDLISQKTTVLDDSINVPNFGIGFWSPDGKRVAFAHADSGIAIIDITTMSRTLLNDSRFHPSGNIVWSPDGSEIAFDNYGNTIISIIHADGTGYRTIPTESATFSFRPQWSTDGKQLLYNVNRSNGRTDCYLYNVSTSTSTLLVSQAIACFWLN